MRYLTMLAFALVGCTQTITLFPRGGGEQAFGSLNDGSQNMEVVLKGETYTGRYVLGKTFGFGTTQTFGARPTFGSGMMVGTSNQATALLTSGRHALRCEFTGAAIIGGNGVCMDKDGVVYDMLFK